MKLRFVKRPPSKPLDRSFAGFLLTVIIVGTVVLLLSGCAVIASEELAPIDPYVINPDFAEYDEDPLWEEEIYECEHLEAEDRTFWCLGGTGPGYLLDNDWDCELLTSDTTNIRPRDCRSDDQILLDEDGQ